MAATIRARGNGKAVPVSFVAGDQVHQRRGFEPLHDVDNVLRIPILTTLPGVVFVPVIGLFDEEAGKVHEPLLAGAVVKPQDDLQVVGATGLRPAATDTYPEIPTHNAIDEFVSALLPGVAVASAKRVPQEGKAVFARIHDVRLVWVERELCGVNPRADQS